MKTKHCLSSSRPSLEDPRAETEKHDLWAVRITQREVPHLLLLFGEADLFLAISRCIEAIPLRQQGALDERIGSR
jgi:hypothetical protein